MKKTEDELIRLISRLETMIDNLPFEIWFKDSDGKYLVVNKVIENNLGLPKDRIIGKKDSDLYPKVLADLYEKTDHEVIAEKKRLNFVSEYQNELYDIQKTPIFNEAGELIGLTGYANDISESAKMQKALIESERSKAVLLSNLPGVAYRSNNDPGFTMSFISEGCYDLTGYTAEQLLNKNPSYYDLILPEYREKLFEKWDKIINLNMISTDEYPIITASGETKWVWEKSQEIFDSENQVVATEGFITDITERMLAEKALQISEERFRTMFEEAPLGIGIFDAVRGKAFQINNRFAEIVGRSKEELLALNLKQYTHPDDITEDSHNLNLINSHKISRYSVNKRFIKPDGSIVWVNMTIAPFKREENRTPRHLCMIEDITERKQKEEEILYLSYYDQLTGLYNRRYYEEELKRIDTARNLPITVVMADVNGLKLINDALGHLVGDQLLKKVAGIIKKECRADDIIARIGGDEFVILLPKTDSIEAEKIIKRISSVISKEKINCINCSASFGYATKKVLSEDITHIYMHAEDWMYKHKLSASENFKKEAAKLNINTGRSIFFRSK